MTTALQDTCLGLEILYSPIHLSHVPQPRWQSLGPFWYSTLQQWYRLLQSPNNTTSHDFDDLQAPPWRHSRRVFGPSKRPLKYASSHCQWIYQHGYQHLSDFIALHGSHPASGLSKSLFPTNTFHRKREHSATATVLARGFDALGLLHDSISHGPFLPQHIAAAFPPWSFKDKRFTKLQNADLYRLLHVLPKKAIPPTKHLK